MAFSRYELMRKEKFSFFVDTSIGYVRGDVKEKSGSVTKKVQTKKTVGGTVRPFIAYDLSDKFSILMSSDLLSLDASFFTVKYEETGEKVKTHYFGISAKSDIFTEVGYLNIGLIYKF